MSSCRSRCASKLRLARNIPLHFRFIQQLLMRNTSLHVSFPSLCFLNFSNVMADLFWHDFRVAPPRCGSATTPFEGVRIKIRKTPWVRWAAETARHVRTVLHNINLPPENSKRHFPVKIPLGIQLPSTVSTPLAAIFLSATCSRRHHTPCIQILSLLWHSAGTENVPFHKHLAVTALLPPHNEIRAEPGLALPQCFRVEHDIPQIVCLLVRCTPSRLDQRCCDSSVLERHSPRAILEAPKSFPEACRPFCSLRRKCKQLPRGKTPFVLLVAGVARLWRLSTKDWHTFHIDPGEWSGCCTGDIVGDRLPVGHVDGVACVTRDESSQLVHEALRKMLHGLASFTTLHNLLQIATALAMPLERNPLHTNTSPRLGRTLRFRRTRCWTMQVAGFGKWPSDKWSTRCCQEWETMPPTHWQQQHTLSWSSCSHKFCRPRWAQNDTHWWQSPRAYWRSRARDHHCWWQLLRRNFRQQSRRRRGSVHGVPGDPSCAVHEQGKWTRQRCSHKVKETMSFCPSFMQSTCSIKLSCSSREMIRGRLSVSTTPSAKKGDKMCNFRIAGDNFVNGNFF